MFAPSSNEIAGHGIASKTDPIAKLAAELQEMHGKASVISQLWTAAEQQGKSLDWLRREHEEIGARMVDLEDRILSAPAASVDGAIMKLRVAETVANGGASPLVPLAMAQAVDTLTRARA